MANINDIVKLAVDAYKGNLEKYSLRDSQETIKQALIEANNGSTVLDYRAIRDGKCSGLFTIIEEILSRTVVEGIQENDFFNAFVDFRNVAEGDMNEFVIEDSVLFVVDEVADGTQALRRQRLGGESTVALPTSMKMVRIYEELNRVLAGRVDFNHMINLVSQSFNARILNDIYTVWAGATAEDMGGVVYFPTAGSYSAEALLELIAHVEAASGGKTATILGTKKALRTLQEDIQADSAKEELHNFGYYGKFYGTPCIAIPQRHKVGTTEFLYGDDVLTIIAGDDKPIKFVYEGNPIVLMGDPMNNMDFTQEYLYGVKYGVGIVLAGGNAGIGRYEFT